MTLQDLKIGQSAVITVLGGEGALRQHMLDMGLLPGEVVTLKQFAPMGDPIEVNIRGYELTLRRSDAANISVEPVAEDAAGSEPEAEQRKRKDPPMVPDHPGLGTSKRTRIRFPRGPCSPLPSRETRTAERRLYLTN